MEQVKQAQWTRGDRVSFQRLRKGNYMNRSALMRRFFPNGMPSRQEGKMGYILAWLLGIPIPVLFLIFLLRGCD
jgi:hypothetical protein